MARFFRMLSASLLLPLLAGCHQAAMHLRVPPGFHGQIVVSCDSNGEAGTNVDVDAQGHGHASICPSDGGTVDVESNGRSTRADGVEWLKTGDGLVTQLRLMLK